VAVIRVRRESRAGAYKWTARGPSGVICGRTADEACEQYWNAFGSCPALVFT